MADYTETFYNDLPGIPSITHDASQHDAGNYDGLVLPTIPSITPNAEVISQWSNPSYVLYYDGSLASYTDYTAEAIDDNPDDVPLTDGNGDILYIGGGSKFYIVEIRVTTAATGSYVLDIEYWDGASWTNLDIVGYDDLNEYRDVLAGRFAWIADKPDDWAQNAVDGKTAHWIRIREDADTTIDGLAGRVLLHFASQAFSDTLTDTITITDALTKDVGVNLADGLNLADDIDAGAGANLGDIINLTDAVVADASKQLADGISIADQLIVAARISGLTLADVIVLNDILRLSAHVELADIVSLNDALIAGNQVFLGDTIHLNDTLKQDARKFLGDNVLLNDALALGAGVNLADGVNLTDQIVILTPSILLEDIITLTDNIDNIIPGVSNVAVGETIKNWNQPIQWEKAVGNQPSSLSGITDSSKNTTFGQENPYTVLDASAWDLSKVEVGYIAVTTSGFMGIVISIGINTVTVQNWHKAGFDRVYGATDLPEDGESVTIHYRLRAKRVLIRSKEGNSNTIYVEQDGRYMNITSGHPLVATQWKRSSEVEISAPRDRWLNLSRIWITSLTSQTAVVIVDGEIPHTRGE